MLRFAWFESESDLQKLTGLTHSQLWDAGFNLDDWDFGIRCNKQIHTYPTEQEIADGDGYEGELVPDWDSEGSWLFQRFQDYCCGASYVKLGRWHYYLIHHA